MTYRTGATEKVASTAFLETEYKTNAAVTRKTTGVTGAAEVQKISSIPITQHVYVLDVGAVTLTTASLDATPTIAELVTAIENATGYGAAPFVVTAGTGNELVLTWGSNGAVADTAVLMRNDVSVGTTYLVRSGGVAEVQTVAHGTLTEDIYVLKVGSTTLTTASLDATPTKAELVSAIQAATGYGAAPFTVAAGAGAEIVLTWKAAAKVDTPAKLMVDGVEVGTTAITTEGTAAAKKMQRIAVSEIGAYDYKLVVDTVTLTYTAGASSKIGDIVAGLKQDGDYAGAPFTITAVYPDQIQVEWKVAGVEADSAVLTASGVPCGTVTETTVGKAAVVEVQEFTPVLDAQSIYRLTVGSVVLTTAALDATPTIAELNTALQADADYATAGFTTAVNGSKIEATWDAAGTVATLGAFDYREYIEGPYTTAIPAGVAAIRAISTAAFNFAIGPDAEATASDALVPANTAVEFKVSKGDRFSFKGTADIFVTHLYE